MLVKQEKKEIEKKEKYCEIFNYFHDEYTRTFEKLFAKA